MNYDIFVYYLKRHIQLDGDDHGPLSRKMVTRMCNTDKEKWDDVLEIAK